MQSTVLARRGCSLLLRSQQSTIAHLSPPLATLSNSFFTPSCPAPSVADTTRLNVRGFSVEADGSSKTVRKQDAISLAEFMPLFFEEQVRKHKIVPDLLPEFTSQTELKVFYGPPYTNLQYGNPIERGRCKKAPEVAFEPPKKQTRQKRPKHTILMIDIDAEAAVPKHTILMIDIDAEMGAAPDGDEAEKVTTHHRLQWAHVNIGGRNLATGTEYMRYQAPVMHQRSQLHRVVMLLFKHSVPLEFGTERLSDEERNNFNLSAFQKKWGLEAPVAINFFYCAPADVTHLYKHGSVERYHRKRLGLPPNYLPEPKPQVIKEPKWRGVN
eukprot:g6979.t1